MLCFVYHFAKLTLRFLTRVAQLVERATFMYRQRQCMQSRGRGFDYHLGKNTPFFFRTIIEFCQWAAPALDPASCAAGTRRRIPNGTRIAKVRPINLS